MTVMTTKPHYPGLKGLGLCTKFGSWSEINRRVPGTAKRHLPCTVAWLFPVKASCLHHPCFVNILYSQTSCLPLRGRGCTHVPNKYTFYEDTFQDLVCFHIATEIGDHCRLAGLCLAQKAQQAANDPSCRDALQHLLKVLVLLQSNCTP